MGKICRLPQEVSPSTYIGYACLPLSYQQLPKTHQCTIIGWGKRRNTDEAGTSLLHEAEVCSFVVLGEEFGSMNKLFLVTKTPTRCQSSPTKTVSKSISTIR